MLLLKSKKKADKKEYQQKSILKSLWYILWPVRKKHLSDIAKMSKNILYDWPLIKMTISLLKTNSKAKKVKFRTFEEYCLKTGIKNDQDLKIRALRAKFVFYGYILISLILIPTSIYVILSSAFPQILSKMFSFVFLVYFLISTISQWKTYKIFKLKKI